jgi:3',5'-cyclic-AMP phosphodiesterase
VTGPFLLVQLSDPHIGARWVPEPDPATALRAAVASALRVARKPDAVLVSGDLTEHGGEEEYATVRELLAPLGAPVHALPGNHDDRAALRRAFELPGSGADPVQYSVDLGPLRLVVLDTTIPGADPGELDDDRLRWLDAELSAAPEQATVIAMHHPPIATGVPVWDEIGLGAESRYALAEVVAPHIQVKKIVAGHVHREILGELVGCPVLTAPSTYLQAKLDFGVDRIELGDDPPGFVVHALVDGDLVSHVQPVDA